MDILLFVADNWTSKFDCSDIKNIPLIKYVGGDGDVSLFSMNECTPGNRQSSGGPTCNVRGTLDPPKKI
jgi:hypothetical protein